MPEQVILNLREAAEFLGFAPARMSALLRGDIEGVDAIPHTRVGKSIRIHRDAIEEWVKEGGKVESK